MNTDPKRILIVDDEENLTWSISNNLKRAYKDYEIVSAYSGDEALVLLKEKPFNLVISDIRMPGTNGLAVLEYIKENMPESKVILMTSYVNPEIRKIVDGSDIYFLEKPFDIGEFKKTIQHVLSNDNGITTGKKINKSLKEILKENYKNDFSGHLKIKKNDDGGEIVFREGKVIHAYTKALTGDMALINILHWDIVKCDIMEDSNEPVQKTIYYAWKLLEKELVSVQTDDKIIK